MLIRPAFWSALLPRLPCCLGVIVPKLLGDGLHELRDVGTGVRLFYVLLPDNHAALLDGMTKKRDDIPDAMMKRLRTLQGAVNAEFKKPKKGR
jgi:Phage derived protein Gp49-like (DUF891)